MSENPAASRIPEGPEGFDAAMEPERYELLARPAYSFEMQRRDFFKVLGAGILIFCVAKEAFALQESGGGRRQFGGQPLPKEISAWLHLGENGMVTTYTGKVEVGQNVRTSLSQAVAEELRFPIEKITLVMGDTQLTPYDAGTFGSRTTPTMNLKLRQVSAAARDALIELAAKQWNTDAKDLAAADGKITDSRNNRSVEYAELLKGRQITQNIPAEDPLIPPAQWTVEGTPVPKVDGRDFVTGKHRYPSDQALPGMLYGKVLRPPAFGATLSSVDTRPAEQTAGLVVVHDGDFIGVAAPSTDGAAGAVAGIHAEWKTEPGQPSSENVFEYLKDNPEPGRGGEQNTENPPANEASAPGAQRMSATYTVAYIAHAPLEPRAALAQWTDDNHLTVWTGTQRPFGVRQELAQAFRLPEDNVRVLMPDTGAAYGGKHTGECAVEAARLAKAAKKPVKLVWTREEEFTWAYFRPVGVIDVRATLDGGQITEWEFDNYNSGGAGLESFYAIPHKTTRFHRTKYPLRQGSYRALAATANHFARESFMDELAHAAKVDPLEFRLNHLHKDDPTQGRLRAVFEAAAEKFGWGKSAKAAGHGFGMGGGFEKAGNVATFAEVAVDEKSGDVSVVRLATAFEGGAVVNPDGLRNQLTGANIMGIGGALFEHIDFANGRILNPRFSKYRVPRFSDAPKIEVVLLDRKDIPPAGAGESPIMGVAPAIGNAIFDAIGTRLRAMPMAPHGLKKA
ncbi:MAG TPA: molybdopterin cofactor-binding domain-containing protein [Candidatus Acidoferrales bacterium]|nr:molybdopterin cofactor-binding domain-containing protein [Candidatus Acidoferrales bacterium]